MLPTAPVGENDSTWVTFCAREENAVKEARKKRNVRMKPSFQTSEAFTNQKFLNETLDVEPEVHYIAIFYDVLFSLNPKKSRVLDLRFGFVFE